MKNRFGIKLQAIVLCLVLLISNVLYTSISVLADDVFVNAGDLEDNYYTPVSEILGYETDPDKNYEIVESTLFNQAGKEVWDLTKNGKIGIEAGQTVKGHNVVKLTTDSSAKGGEVYFWNEKSPALPEEKLEGRTSFGKLFAGYNATEYTGIRIYLNKEKTNQKITYQVLLGSMSKGYWPSSGFYTYELSLPKKAYDGYVYLPFEDFKNSQGSKLNVATPNFIAFKYSQSTPASVDLYVGELGLWREGEGGIKNSGKLNIGLGETLKADKEYMYYTSLLFNESTAKDWETAKLSGFNVTAQYKGEGYYPTNANSAVKFSTTGTSKYPEAFFWDQKTDGSSSSKGILFGTDINITDYDGVRLWVKTGDGNPYSLITIMIGSKPYYQSEEQGGYYSYNLVIYGGYEGYVNIPFENFVNSKGESVEVKDFNFIAFKHGENAYVKSDIYVSDLQIYGLKENNTFKDKPIGAQIDTNKDYEIVESTLFNQAGKEVWDLTKNGKISIEAEQTYKGHKVVKFTTDESSRGGEVYFWNEKSPALPEEKLEGRTSFGRLFAGYNATEYTGIRFYVSKAETQQSITYQVLFGSMSKGYWPGSGFYTYEFTLPKKAYEGYVYLPFKEFLNSEGASVNTTSPNFVAFKYAISSSDVIETYFGELGLWREGDGGIKNTGKLNIGLGETLKADKEYMYYTSLMFNKSTAKDWSTAKLSGFEVTPQYTQKGYYPKEAKSSVKLSSNGTSKYPEAFYWEQNEDGSSSSKGILFGTDINITDYDGVRLWVKTGDGNPYSLITIMIGSKPYYQSEEQGGYYSYNLVIYGGYEGYVNIPFENFVNSKGESVEVKDFNFIAFKHGENAYVKSDIYVSDLQVYGLKENNTFKDKPIGAQIDTNKDYEIVESTLFNQAGKEVWDLTKNGKINIETGKTVKGHKVVKFTTDESSRGGEVYFWNEKSPALPEEKLEGRTSFGRLFAGYNATEYTGIRFYVSKAETQQSITYQVLFGSMSKGYWPSGGFYTYEFTLPKNEYEGYVYLPFREFLNSEGASVNSSNPNFVAFKYKIASNDVIETYFGELGLWREGDKKISNTGKLNIGLGETLKADKEYMYYSSMLFNTSTKKEWATAKLSGFEVTPNYKKEGYYPEGAHSSIRFSTTGTSKYPEAFYWEQNEDGSSLSKGIVFGTNINITDYDGVRLWVKTGEGNTYSLITVMIGSKPYYQSEEQGGYYSYNLVIYGGYEGYVNIPFKNFVNLKGESVEVKDFNFIAFKHGENAYVKSDIYISDLQIYGLKENNTTGVQNIGVQLDKNKDYELVESLVFADASQKMWEQTKNVGITATAGIKDAEYIPSHGKNSVKIHSTNEKAVHEIYFWNELSDGGRRTHSKLWGTANCTEYEGVRFWIKIAENNTYSKLSVFLGQMYTGYWPREEVGFFTYDIVIPRGGFEGYVNIPLSYFKNKQGETLSAENLNFIGFKYKDSGFRETDFWVSDLLLYREAVEGNVPHENSTIVDGSELQVDHIVADGTIVDTVGGEYLGTKVSGVDSNNDNKDQNNGKVSYLLWIVIAGSLLGVAAGITVLIFILKRKKKPV